MGGGKDRRLVVSPSPAAVPRADVLQVDVLQVDVRWAEDGARSPGDRLRRGCEPRSSGRGHHGPTWSCRRGSRFVPRSSGYVGSDECCLRRVQSRRVSSRRGGARSPEFPVGERSRLAASSRLSESERFGLRSLPSDGQGRSWVIAAGPRRRAPCKTSTTRAAVPGPTPGIPRRSRTPSWQRSLKDSIRRAMAPARSRPTPGSWRRRFHVSADSQVELEEPARSGRFFDRARRDSRRASWAAMCPIHSTVSLTSLVVMTGMRNPIASARRTPRRAPRSIRSRKCRASPSRSRTGRDAAAVRRAAWRKSRRSPSDATKSSTVFRSTRTRFPIATSPADSCRISTVQLWQSSSGSPQRVSRASTMIFTDFLVRPAVSRGEGASGTRMVGLY